MDEVQEDMFKLGTEPGKLCPVDRRRYVAVLINSMVGAEEVGKLMRMEGPSRQEEDIGDLDELI